MPAPVAAIGSPQQKPGVGPSASPPRISLQTRSPARARDVEGALEAEVEREVARELAIAAPVPSRSPIRPQIDPSVPPSSTDKARRSLGASLQGQDAPRGSADSRLQDASAYVSNVRSKYASPMPRATPMQPPANRPSPARPNRPGASALDVSAPQLGSGVPASPDRPVLDCRPQAALENLDDILSVMTSSTAGGPPVAPQPLSSTAASSETPTTDDSQSVSSVGEQEAAALRRRALEKAVLAEAEAASLEARRQEPQEQGRSLGGAEAGALNALLRDNGFSGLPLDGTTAAALAATLTDVLSQYQRRSRLVQDLMQSVELARQRDMSHEQESRELQQQRDEAQREQRRAAKALEAAKRADRKTEDLQAEVKRLEGELSRYRAKYGQLEHLVRSREQEADKLRDKLAERVAREERRTARDKEVYERLKRVHATAGGSRQSPSSGSVNAAVRELRPVEIVSLYEAQRDQQESELAVLRKESQSLAEELREARNLIARKDRTHGWRNPGGDAEERVDQAERRAADLARELNEERARASEAVRQGERRAAEWERKAERLAEENAALILEIESRPSSREVRSLQRQVEILERQLARAKDLREEGAAGVAGADAEANEQVLAAAASHGLQGSERLGTRDRIRRDREVHRLGLRHVEQLPRDVLVDLVQDACIALECTEATALSAQLAKVLRAVAALPGLERFASEVCDVVLRLGRPFLPAETKGAALTGKDAPQVVPKALRHWLRQLHEAQDAQSCLRALHTELARRVASLPGQQEAEAALPAVQSQALLLAAVRQLVDVERAALGAQDTIKAAEGVLAQDPSMLLHRIVQHFQHLFDSPRLEGVLPRMNQVYVTLNEGRNCLRSLALVLGLPEDASPHSITSAVRGLVQMGVGFDRELPQALQDALKARLGFAAFLDAWAQANYPRSNPAGPRARQGPRAAAAGRPPRPFVRHCPLQRRCDLGEQDKP